MKAMRAIIYKELRENTKWLVLLALAVGVALAFGADLSVHREMSIVGNEFQMATILSFSIVGAIVGLLQILQDEKSSRAPFIAHRPISMTKMFAAKVFAGLVIYFVAVGVPLALVIFFVQFSGRVNQPFDWRMTLPAVSDIVGGVLCYFTGILIAARPARWIGTRVMPVALTFFVLTVAYALSMGFWYSLMFIGGGILIVLPAAAGAFISRGQFERFGWMIRTLQVVCVGVGIATAVGAAFALTGETLRTLLYPNPRTAWTYSVYRLDLNGRPMVVTYGTAVPTVTDLKGNLLSGPSLADIALNHIGLSGAWLTSQGPWSKNQSFDDRLLYFRFRDPKMHLYPLTHYETGTNWYYVVDRRTIEGVDTRTGQLQGSFGPSGFVPVGQPLQPFVEPITIRESSAQGWADIITPTRIQKINLIDQTASLRFSTSPNDPILSMNWFSDIYSKVGREPVASPYTAVRTESAIYVLNGTTEVLHLPVEYGPDQNRTINVLQIPAGGFVVEYGDSDYHGQWLVTTDATGHVVDRQTLPPLRQREFEVRSGEWLDWLEVPAVPPVLVATKLLSEHSVHSFNGSLIEIVILPIASALAGFWISRRYRFGRGAEIVWSVMGLLFGVPGVLTLLAMRNLPSRIRCAKCGKLRLVNLTQCEHCGSSFDAPTAEGIEIFEHEITNESFALT